MTNANALEDLLYEKPIRKTYGSSTPHVYRNGMFITINNHRSTAGDLYQNYKRQYQTLYYGLTGRNVSRESIVLQDKQPPSKQLILKLLNARKIIVVAGIHDYSNQDKRGKHSNRNYEYQHQHLYVYGVDKHVPNKHEKIHDKEQHLERLLKRYNKTTRRRYKEIVIEPVGYGKYQYNEQVNPVNLHDYLLSPSHNPSRECIINYIANNRHNPAVKYPLTFIYHEHYHEKSTSTLPTK